MVKQSITDAFVRNEIRREDAEMLLFFLACRRFPLKESKSGQNLSRASIKQCERLLWAIKDYRDTGTYEVYKRAALPASSMVSGRNMTASKIKYL
jgi:hypothetical protein